MERRVRAHRHAGRDHSKAQRRAERDVERAGSDRATRQAQRRIPAEHAGGVSQLRGCRNGEVEPRREGGEHQAGVSSLSSAKCRTRLAAAIRRGISWPSIKIEIEGGFMSNNITRRHVLK